MNKTVACNLNNKILCVSLELCVVGCTHAHTHTRIHAHTNIRIHEHTHTRSDACTHHIHTHTTHKLEADSVNMLSTNVQTTSCCDYILYILYTVKIQFDTAQFVISLRNTIR